MVLLGVFPRSKTIPMIHQLQVKSLLAVAFVSFTLGVVTLLVLGPSRAEPGYPPKYGKIPEKTIWFTAFQWMVHQ